jgi:hypothetical protein
MATEQSPPTVIDPICSLPVVGATTIEDAVFYAAVGTVAMFGLVSWPAAGLIGAGHALHQRARNVVRSGAIGETREGLIEAVDDVI